MKFVGWKIVESESKKKKKNMNKTVKSYFFVKEFKNIIKNRSSKIVILFLLFR